MALLVAALLYNSSHGWLHCRYVLLKERNMLASEQGRRKARGEKLPNPTRATKVCFNLPAQHKQQKSFSSSGELSLWIVNSSEQG